MNAIKLHTILNKGKEIQALHNICPATSDDLETLKAMINDAKGEMAVLCATTKYKFIVHTMTHDHGLVEMTTANASIVEIRRTERYGEMETMYNWAAWGSVNTDDLTFFAEALNVAKMVGEWLENEIPGGLK